MTPPAGMFGPTRTASAADVAAAAEIEVERSAAEEMEQAAWLRARLRRLELEAEIREVDPWYAERDRANTDRQNAKRKARRDAAKAGITDPTEIARLADEAAARVDMPRSTLPHGVHEGNRSPHGDDVLSPMDKELRREVDRRRKVLASRSVERVMIEEAPSAAEIVVDLTKAADTDATRFRAARFVVEAATAAGRTLDLGDLAAEIAGMSPSRAVDAVALAVLEGRLTIEDGDLAMRLVEARIAALSVDDLLGRIDAL